MNETEKIQTLKELSRPSIFEWMRRALQNWVEIAVIYFAMYKLNHWLAYAIGVLLLGTRMHALALLGHEAIHRNISKTKWLNNAIGNFFAAYPLFQDLEFYKTFHINHHAHALTPDDPEIHFREAHIHKWEMPMTAAKRWKIILIDLSGIGYLDTRHAIPQIWPHISVIDLLKPIIFWLPVGLTLDYFDQGWMFLCWYIAFLTSYWAMFRQRAITEHLKVEGEYDTHKISANLFQRFFYLPHNTWYHYEHHKRADIPCWNLPKMREMDPDNVKTVEELFTHMSST